MVQAAKGLETILMKYNVDIWNAGANENNQLPFLTFFSFFDRKRPRLPRQARDNSPERKTHQERMATLCSVLRFSGHVHDYQVTWPIVNGTAPNQVRKRIISPLRCHFILKPSSLYQDRLGTSIGKGTLHSRREWLRFMSHIALQGPAGPGLHHRGQWWCARCRQHSQVHEC